MRRECRPHPRRCCHYRLVASAGFDKNARTSTGARQATTALRPQCKCIIQISGFQYPKTAYVLIGLRVRPVGDEHLVMISPLSCNGLRAGRLPCLHDIVERAGLDLDRSSKKFASSRFRWRDLLHRVANLNRE